MNQGFDIDSAQSNAMTEVALALAMGFFALMILAIVSMGPAMQEQTAGEDVPFPAIQIAPVAPGAGATAKPAPDDRFILHWRGGYLDAEARPVDPGAMSVPDGGRLILAVDPQLPMAETMTALAGLKREGVIVTALSEAWLARLRGGKDMP